MAELTEYINRIKNLSTSPILILDAGHGGIHFSGNPVTSGKGCNYIGLPMHHKNYFCEGWGNRAAANQFAAVAMLYGVHVERVYSDRTDTPLATRVRTANSIYNSLTATDKKRCVFISLHSDAHSSPDTRGCKIFRNADTRDLDKRSLELAKMAQGFIEAMGIPELTRVGIHTAPNFFVLKHTEMPAILIERGFHTNKDDAVMLCQTIYLQLIKAAEAMITAKKPTWLY
jgi:N-acetylmuramoyl-L-alanine amidase